MTRLPVTEPDIVRVVHPALADGRLLSVPTSDT